MAFTVACAQFAPEKAEVDRNLDTIAEVIVQAHGEGADLLVLPETSTSGYFLEGGVLEASLTKSELVDSLWNRLRGKLSRPIDVSLGFYLNEEGNLYNAAAYLEINPEGPKVVGLYRKFFLPTYGVFDEERFVSRGRDVCVMETRLGRFAMLVCEDVWHGIMPTICAVRGAQLLIVPSASPARGFHASTIDNLDRYRRLFRAIAEEHGLWCVNAQLVGFEGGKGFIGGSSVIDPLGRTVGEAPIAEAHLMLAEIDLELVTIARAQSPLLSDLQSAWEEIRRLVANTDF
jgi:N-carbamoylputrescine amidase